MDINTAKKNVIEAGRKLVEKGLIARTWGNVSCRVDDNHFVITPSGMSYETIHPEDIVRVRIDTMEYEGSVKPSSEKGIHASVYKLKPEMNFVIHTHQTNASAVSAANIESMKTSGRYSLLGEKVILAGYGLPGTKNLRKNVGKALSKSTGLSLIMKKHGALNYGMDMDDAFNAAEQLETACENFIKDNYSCKSGNWLFSPQKLGELVLNTKIENNGTLDAYRDCIVNDSPYAVAVSNQNKPLYPYLDDFAQIVGPKMMVVENAIDNVKKALEKVDAVFIKGYGAVCKGKDKEAVSMIVEKNSKAYLTAKLFSSTSKPINGVESNLMRMVYMKKYSKQMV